MTEFAPPYQSIDPSDDVLVAQAHAFELIVAANTGELVDPEVVASVAVTASELAMSANLNLLSNRRSSVI